MSQIAATESVVQVIRPEAGSEIVLVCEHASAHIPAAYGNLGLDAAALQSHIAWDPGALAIARHMSAALDAVLVASTVSRLVYDCNRPPEADDAMPARSEAHEVPGNRALTQDARAARTRSYYMPFRAALAAQVARKSAPVLITIHSFTPVYLGKRRAVEIGILHDSDSRLADAFLQTAAAHTDLNVQRNAPYGPDDGVTHTLREHALAGGFHNVMIELRSDLIASPEAQAAMAAMITGWTKAALRLLEEAPCRP